jgi:hypothetical protein
VPHLLRAVPEMDYFVQQLMNLLHMHKKLHQGVLQLGLPHQCGGTRILETQSGHPQPIPVVHTVAAVQRCTQAMHKQRRTAWG